ncbi:URC4/urg3 family protein [Poseidonocella sp. HB161398]|uniref:URC4/urg3 family protein n=1 Tax=Poseidonocella sp. HB161398 TaxID=2320855 RepID=UPI00197E85C0|nr:URC4/urg3 family protein [Poseidonocella sp. HB161398]
MTTTDLAEADTAATADWLQSPDAIRAQCGALYDLGVAGRLDHFTVDPDRLEIAAEEVVATILETYPDLAVPPHSRWRHFVLDRRDRWAEQAAKLDVPPQEMARLECELAIVSVLLDAGAGPLWTYHDPDTGAEFARSEGLALASLDMFMAGAFGSGTGPGTTTARLSRFSAEALAAGFQVTEDNPLEGLEGRAALIAALGKAVEAQPLVFGDTPRLGQIADHLAGLADEDGLPAETILRVILKTLSPIWGEDRPVLDGVSLGDCWPHPQAPAPGLVPFHKLSQWLSYSLIEPMERAGIKVTGLDRLTGLAEYRNGGLFLDTGVIALRHPREAAKPQAPGSALIVEWRALTVILLDKVAALVRKRLRLSAEELPLAAVLEGGTWATGRRLARAKRPGGTPPIDILSTGTVF